MLNGLVNAVVDDGDMDGGLRQGSSHAQGGSPFPLGMMMKSLVSPPDEARFSQFSYCEPFARGYKFINHDRTRPSIL